MSGYTDSEKVQYALKTALSRTMQTAMSDSAGAERSAPMRIFPSNIMKVDIIEKGKGDIDEDGNYITGHKNAGTAADMSNPEDTVKNYKIICPVNNVVTSITISSLVSYGSSTLSFINGRDTTGTNYPLKQWFYRGHLSGSGESAFGQANTNYHGLQLAWNSVADGSTPSDDNTVPHLKYYLQVQTVYTGVSNSAALDNITYEHTLLKGLIGLDSNFISTIMVAQGEGGPSSSASLGTSGSEAGDYWFTQATAGILSFYGVTSKVDSGTDLNTANFATKFPMISFVRYVGETGFGAGSGGGGSTSLASADSNVSNMIGGTPQTMTTTTFNFDGKLEINGGYNSSHIRISEGSHLGQASEFRYPALSYYARYDYTSRTTNPLVSGTGNSAGGASSSIVFVDKPGNASHSNNVRSSDIAFYTANNNVGGLLGHEPLERMRITNTGNVGIGTTAPKSGLQVIHDQGLTISGTATTGVRTAVLRLGSPYTTDVNNIENYCAKITSTNNHTMNYGADLRFYTHPNGQSFSGSPHQPTERMCILNNGEVGIGTTSPQSLLHLAGTGDVVLRLQADTDNNGEGDNPMIEFRQDGNLLTGLIGTGNLPTGAGVNDNAMYLQHCGSTGIVFLSGPSQNTQSTSVERMRITPSGNVGIGTTDPKVKLNVEGGGFLVGGVDTVTQQGCHIQWNRSGEHGETHIINNIGGAYNNGVSSGIKFAMTDSNGTVSDKMFIRNDGNVGIGTMSPYSKLEIKGDDYTGDPTNHVAQLLRLTQEYTQDFASSSPEGGVGMQFLIDNQNQNYWPIGEIYFYCSNNDNSETDGSLRFRVSNNNDTSGSASDRANVDAMTIHHSGNVGIGTTSPNHAFEIEGQLGMGYNLGGTALYGYKSLGTTSSSSYKRGHEFLNANGNSMMCILHYGTGYTNPKVGIGTTSPGFPLEISGDATGPYIGQVGYMTSTGHPTTSGANADPISLKTSNVIWSQGYIMASSDRRIKENIVDVSDNLALEMLRNIPVKYYEYKDKLIKGNEKTLGFIAQEVKEIIPIAVSIQKNIIPNEMRMLENTLWEEIIDGSNNTYKLTTDLQDVSGIKYRFYVSNDPSGNDECIKEVVGNQDNTFSFDSSYNNVFCYGKEVDDFHTLDKQKLFALNFSATQELDRQQQADKAKINELENKVSTLESELAAIKQHLGI